MNDGMGNSVVCLHCMLVTMAPPYLCKKRASQSIISPLFPQNVITAVPWEEETAEAAEAEVGVPRALR